jgi:hypothetical protein
MKIKEKAKEIVGKAEKEVLVIKGEESKDRIYESHKTFDKEQEAIIFFKEAKNRLFDINGWSTISAIINSNFQLFNSKGEKSKEIKPVLGDYIRIKLPGPLPYNWVLVMDIKEESNFCEFTVSPSEAPTDNASEQTKHFFTKAASSTFKIERKGNSIYAYEIGKEEAVNSKGPEAGNRGVLNAIVAEGGWAGVQQIQWKNLTDYLVGHK